jgi:uncharacterized RDD family membrane protein YckC
MARTARVWKRILAFLFDLVLGLLFFAPLVTLLASEVPATLTTSMQPTPLAMVVLAYVWVFLFLYHAFCEYTANTTPGMLLFGLSVKAKKPLTFGQAAGRNAFLLVMPILPLLAAIDFIYYYFQGERLLERWTHTETVE